MNDNKSCFFKSGVLQVPATLPEHNVGILNFCKPQTCSNSHVCLTYHINISTICVTFISGDGADGGGVTTGQDSCEARDH